MKIFSVFVAVVVCFIFGPLLYAQSSQSVNGWAFVGAQGTDTAYSNLLPCAGNDTCQLFGYKTVSTDSTVLTWRKNLPPFRRPNYFLLNVRLEGAQPTISTNSALLKLRVGSQSITYPTGNGWFRLTPGDTAWFLNQEFPTDPSMMELVNYAELKFSLGARQPDGAEYVLNNLRAVYGTNPWAPDSVIVIDSFGESRASSVNELSGLPESFQLAQNYPNPFNPSTIIGFELMGSGYTSLMVYNMLGERVATLVDEKLNIGKYEASWNAAGMPSGTYFYRLTTNGFVQTKKMVLLK